MTLTEPVVGILSCLVEVTRVASTVNMKESVARYILVGEVTTIARFTGDDASDAEGILQRMIVCDCHGPATSPGVPPIEAEEVVPGPLPKYIPIAVTV